MNKILFILITAFLLSKCSSSAQFETVDQLKEVIEHRLSAVDGDFALAFKSLDDTTQHIFINGREMFHAASTMKTPVMIELFKQAGEGKFSLEDSITVRNEFRSIVDSSRYRMEVSEDSEGNLYDIIGQHRTIRNLIDDMITMSSNLATNILIEKVDARNVTETMRSYGADSILVLRGVEDIKAYEQGLSNRTTALDESLIYERLARGKAVNKKASEEMTEILQQQKFNEMIPALLPGDVEVAHKTGWITGVNHDCGIVMLPDGRKYVLVMLSKDAENRDEVITTFADISSMIYDFVKGKP